MRAAMIVATAVFLASTSLVLACGKERWPVKTGTDADAGSVVTVAQVARIGDLAALPAPADPNAQSNSRFAPIETSTFSITAVLSVIKREKDEDYHLVISDPNDPSVTMIVESPNPHQETRAWIIINDEDRRRRSPFDFIHWRLPKEQ